jgi:hypothetical protein
MRIPFFSRKCVAHHLHRNTKKLYEGTCGSADPSRWLVYDRCCQCGHKDKLGFKHLQPGVERWGPVEPDSEAYQRVRAVLASKRGNN